MDQKFAQDKDLMFLYNCSNEELKLLVDILVYNKKGDTRTTELLTIDEYFQKAYPHNLKAVLPIIINELQEFGGNTIFNFFRGHGITYKEILIKVCKKNKVNFNANTSTELLEQYLLQKLLMIAVEKMSDEDVKHLGDIHTQRKDMLIKNIALFHAADPLIIKMVTALVIEVAKKNGLKALAGIAGKFAGGRAFAVLTGPIGWAVGALWTIFDIAGPAYRVMIPATITVAYLRMISKRTDAELAEIFN